MAMNRRGQSMLEFAIAFAGLIIFIYVFLNVWVWLNGILVQRQQTFQRTRLAAGQPSTAGTPVGYVRPPIKLIGPASSPGGDPPPTIPPPTPGPPPPPCEAAQPYYDQAAALTAEANALMDQATQALAPVQGYTEQIQILIEQIRQLELQIQQLEADIAALQASMATCVVITCSTSCDITGQCTDTCYDDYTICDQISAQIAAMQAQLDDLYRQLALLQAQKAALEQQIAAAWAIAGPLIDQANALNQQALDLIAQGDAACPPP